MSLSLPDDIRVVLCPDRVGVLRTGYALTLRGYERKVVANGVVACEAGAEDAHPWSSAVETLVAALDTVIERKEKAQASVILSNQFVHYLLVPWLKGISDEEELAYAQQCFRDRYGDVADTWTIRTSQGRPGRATLASAVDGGLLADLRELLGHAGLTLRSIQPHLMTACNSCHATLEGRSAWVALLEPDNVCLALLQQGHMVWIRKHRVGAEWEEVLPQLIEREQFVADADAEMEEVLLWAPHLDEREIGALGRWKVQQLRPTGHGSHAYAGLCRIAEA